MIGRFVDIGGEKSVEHKRTILNIWDLIQNLLPATVFVGRLIVYFMQKGQNLSHFYDKHQVYKQDMQ